MPDRSKITPMVYLMLPWIAAVAFFMQTLDTSILNTALPTMAKDLNESPVDMQSTIIAYALTLALFIPVSGYLADRFGTRNIFIASLALFSLGSLFCSLSPNLLFLDISRVIQGIGGSMMVPVSRLALLKTFERSRFLDAINTSTLFGLIGPFLGPLLGGYLVEHATWHWIFLINIPIGVIGIILSILFMPNVKDKMPLFDLYGLFLIALAFILTTLSFELVTQADDYRLPSITLVVALILFITYYYYAKRSPERAIFPLSLFAIRTFKFGVLGNLFCRLGSQSIPFLLPLCLQLIYGYSPLASGMMLVPIAIGAILMKKMVTSILGFFHFRPTLIFGTAMVGIIIFILAFINLKDQPWLLAFLLFLFGLANSLRFTAMSTVTLADLYGPQTSSGNTILSVTQQLAITFGVAIGALLVRIFDTQNPFLEPTLINSFKVSFVILGIITFISGFIFLKLHPEDGANLLKKRSQNR